jgi:flagellum-specific ATP synthase
MAQRQIGLALGEPPATKGYTPSVFALLPALVERCGVSSQGSITGFYTVLVEGDDLSEPISDAMRGLLDGHLWLSRDLANRRHYPAIDVVESLSRVMTDIVEEQHLQHAQDITRLIAIYRDIEDLVNIGAYAVGSNPEHDLAVQSNDVINNFLQQEMHDGVGYAQAVNQLKELISQIQLISNQSSAAVMETSSSENTPPSSENARPLGLERMMAGV